MGKDNASVQANFTYAIETNSNIDSVPFLVHLLSVQSCGGSHGPQVSEAKCPFPRFLHFPQRVSFLNTIIKVIKTILRNYTACGKILALPREILTSLSAVTFNKQKIA